VTQHFLCDALYYIITRCSAIVERRAAGCISFGQK